MRRSKELKHPYFRPLNNGRYQTAIIPKFTAREGEGEGAGDTGEGAGEGLTAAQKTELNNITHAAITKRLGDPAFRESIGTIAAEAATSAVATATEGFSTKLDELLASKGKGDGKGGNQTGAGSWKDSPEYKDMVERDKDRQTEHDALKQERVDEKESGYRTEERKALEDALRKAGVDEIKIRSCCATLIHEDKVLHRNDAGAIIYRINRGEYNDDLDVTAGVADFLETDEGKTFLPASGSGGTGVVGDSTNQGNNIQRQGQKQTKAEAATVVNEWLEGAGR